MVLLNRVVIIGTYATATFFAGIWVGLHFVTCAVPTVAGNLRPGLIALGALAAAASSPWFVLWVWKRKTWHLVGACLVALPSIYWIVSASNLGYWRPEYCGGYYGP